MRIRSAARITSPKSSYRTFADVLDRLGVTADRVRFDVKPGKATVRDLIRLHDREDRLYELADGFLVEKAMGTKESYVAMELVWHIRTYLDRLDHGFVLGPDGTMRIMPHLVRIPDVSFVSWGKCPGHVVPDDPVPTLFPDLAVEVLSRRNTKKEMERKLREYFESGVRLVWFIDPDTRTAKVYSGIEECEVISESGILTGGDVLPGFSLPLKKLFAQLSPRRGRSKKP